jgi:hypothetical protein
MVYTLLTWAWGRVGMGVAFRRSDDTVGRSCNLLWLCASAQEVGNTSLAIVHSSDMCTREDASVKAALTAAAVASV